jgi:hypothetical protein
VAHCPVSRQTRAGSSVAKPASRPVGLFQHLPIYWRGRAARYGLPGASDKIDLTVLESIIGESYGTVTADTYTRRAREGAP